MPQPLEIYSTVDIVSNLALWACGVKNLELKTKSDFQHRMFDEETIESTVAQATTPITNVPCKVRFALCALEYKTLEISAI